MKRQCLSILMVAFLLLTGCSAGKESMEKQRDIAFTVVSPENIPQELAAELEANKEEGCKITYGDKGYLYIARSYGRQETGGYSVEVTECYETEDTVCVKTSLLGPEKEDAAEEATWPYVVIKIEYTEKYVVFE